MSDQLSAIDHIVILMLENRSFDHMLGFLYADNGNVSPAGQPFDGLTGRESNPDAKGKAVSVFKIQAGARSAYFMPGADPGEGYSATNSQLFGSIQEPTPPTATNEGFVKDFAYTLGWEGKEHRSVLPGTTANNIMGTFTPTMLPVLSGLARGFAVCDQWFCSVPTETLPNRAFALAATSQGHMDDKTKSWTCPSIFGQLSAHNVDWAIYGYDSPPLTRHNFADTTNAAESHFGVFTDFQAAAAGGTLKPFTFLEPSWSASGNSQHPNYDVALGEQLIHDVYYALRNGPNWNSTLLVITYDEHGGCYDHVPPPTNAVTPDNNAGEFGFDFKRFGARVPTVLVSPRIAPGTVFRVAADAMPLDHTSILKTIERRWNLPPLTARDEAANDIGAVLTLTRARTDDPLAGVVVPVSTGQGPDTTEPSHLQQVQAELVSQLPVPDEHGGAHHQMPALKTSADYKKYIDSRTEAWKASRRQSHKGGTKMASKAHGRTHHFGRTPRSFNPRVPHMSALLAGRKLPAPPASVDNTTGMPADFGMMLNDTLGDCTCAAYYHARQVWTYNAQKKEDTEPDKDVELLYEQACGYNPAHGGEGPGGNEQTVLSFVLNTGAPIGPQGTQRDKILAFVEVDPRNTLDIKRTIYDCGVAYIGFPVPSNIVPPGQDPPAVWDYDPNAQMTGEGHAVVLVGYNANGAEVISWGQRYTMTWAFVNNIVDEAYAIADRSWVEATGKTPANMTPAQLEEQMQALRQATRAAQV